MAITVGLGRFYFHSSNWQRASAEHASFFLRRAYFLFTMNIIALVEEFYLIQTALTDQSFGFNNPAPRFLECITTHQLYALDQYHHGSPGQYFHYKSSRSTNKEGGSSQFNNKIIQWAFCLSSKKKGCIPIVQIFIVVPSREQILLIFARDIVFISCFLSFLPVRLKRCQDNEGRLITDYCKTKLLICYAAWTQTPERLYHNTFYEIKESV